jgi:hypothetical protein
MDILGILLIIGLAGFLGYHLILSTQSIDPQRMYDDMIIEEYEQGELEGEVRSVEDPEEEPGPKDKDV